MYLRVELPELTAKTLNHMFQQLKRNKLKKKKVEKSSEGGDSKKIQMKFLMHHMMILIILMIKLFYDASYAYDTRMKKDYDSEMAYMNGEADRWIIRR